VSPPSSDDRFRTAARVYFAYGVVYLLGGVWLVAQGVGLPEYVTGARRGLYVAFWAVVGLIMLLLIPFLLRRPRAWFERWIVSRRDFGRLLSVFMAYRAYKVFQVALRPDTPSVAAPWGGEISFRAGAVVFFVVTVVALAFVARASWTERSP
jgi:hypothetical protein